MVSDGVVKQIESLMYKFLWGSRDKIKRLKTVQDVKLGSLNMVHINNPFNSFKAGWIKRLQFSDPTVCSWSQ